MIVVTSVFLIFPYFVFVFFSRLFNRLLAEPPSRQPRYSRPKFSAVELLLSKGFSHLERKQKKERGRRRRREKERKREKKQVRLRNLFWKWASGLVVSPFFYRKQALRHYQCASANPDGLLLKSFKNGDFMDQLGRGEGRAESDGCQTSTRCQPK